MFVRIGLNKKRKEPKMLEKEFIVEEKHSAKQVGSGGLDVLSTPSMISFMEVVAKEVVEPDLASHQTTVGIEVNVQHLKGTPLGKTVRVTAHLTEQKKTILFYEVKAYQGEELIGEGQHKRAIVDADEFMKNL